MPGLKQTVLAAAASAVLLYLPTRPATAAGPLLFAPWALGHVIAAAARLATLPQVAASAAISAAQPAAPYPPNHGYYGGPAGYIAPPNYYAGPPAYYAQPPGYYPGPQAYYRPARAYAPPTLRFYVPPRSYYAPPTPYARFYGAPVFRAGGFAYRRR
jgi:hypothetical protein